MKAIITGLGLLGYIFLTTYITYVHATQQKGEIFDAWEPIKIMIPLTISFLLYTWWAAALALRTYAFSLMAQDHLEEGVYYGEFDGECEIGRRFVVFLLHRVKLSVDTKLGVWEAKKCGKTVRYVFHKAQLEHGLAETCANMSHSRYQEIRHGCFFTWSLDHQLAFHPESAKIIRRWSGETELRPVEQDMESSAV